MQAAGSGPSRRASAQLRDWLARLKATQETRIIVGGDLNLAVNGQGTERRGEFRERLQLRDSGAGPELPGWNSRDYILYRSGAQDRSASSRRARPGVRRTGAVP